MTHVCYVKTLPKILPSGQDQQKLDCILILLVTSIFCGGLWAWIQSPWIPWCWPRSWMGERRAGRGSEEENQMAERELPDGFSSVVHSPAHIQGRQSHLEGSLTYGKTSQILKHLSLVSAFLASVLGFLTYVVFMGSMCCGPGIHSISAWLGLLCHGASSLKCGCYTDSSEWKIWSHSCFKFFLT